MPPPLTLTEILATLPTLPRQHLTHLHEKLTSLLSRDFISLLPHEIAIQILQHLAPNEIAKLAIVNKSWYIACTNNWMWRGIVEREYGKEGVVERSKRIRGKRTG